MSSRSSRAAGARDAQAEQGFTLVETVVALGLLLVVAAGVLPLGLVAVTTTENQGHLNARAAEYAQDKLEQLMALSYGNSIADTRVFPANATGGSGLTIGGSADPAAPVDLYVDYLDRNGDFLASAGGAPPAGWFYQRVWTVTSPRANLKQITVTVIVQMAAAGGGGRTPQAGVAALKTAPF